MQSSNPVFARNDNFNGRANTRYSDPSQWQIDLSDGSAQQTSQAPQQGQTGRMTLDLVVEKTAITLGLVVLSAATTWFLIGDLADVNPEAASRAAATAMAFAMGGAIIGFVLAMVNSFKKVVSPPLVLAYALVQGAFVGAFSKLISSMVGDPTIVFQAVLATFVAFAGTLAAYKFFNIQVTDRFRKVVTIALFSFLGVIIVNFVLSLTGVLSSGGLRGFNMLGLLVSAVAVVLAVLVLILDFDMVEQGIASGADAREAWRAAFALSVTIIWLYIEMLRIIAILRGD